MLTPNSGERPVFVGGTLRRRQVIVAGGTAAGTALVLAALALVAGFTDPGQHQPPVWPDEGGAVPRKSRIGQTPSPLAPKG